MWSHKGKRIEQERGGNEERWGEREGERGREEGEKRGEICGEEKRGAENEREVERRGGERRREEEGGNRERRREGREGIERGERIERGGVPLLTPICRGVCLRLFLAFRSVPPACSCSITPDSSPNAAWWIARSPSLSSTSKSHPFLTNTFTTYKWTQILFIPKDTVTNQVKIEETSLDINTASSSSSLLPYNN